MSVEQLTKWVLRNASNGVIALGGLAGMIVTAWSRPAEFPAIAVTVALLTAVVVIVVIAWDIATSPRRQLSRPVRWRDLPLIYVAAWTNTLGLVSVAAYLAVLGTAALLALVRLAQEPILAAVAKNTERRRAGPPSIESIP